ncbi:MAG: hypothetical protein A2286_06270 [Gammaproteobacteria bacterium RIFOXYA12_FULL_61_12]|nr:MAG: hypothetical protein A2514_12820 [Gammaproteobacteria bacterium RIFOXYD12_FULL_61_37]OGT93739.1 MAG: hypothetical protein A2286_06270 [Gammaproteobacteria bacterium RIFOXYA12_FULL_61_12]
MNGSGVVRRCVFLVGGYTPKSIEENFARISRDLAKRFSSTWGVEVDQSELVLSENGTLGTKKIRTRGQRWEVETEFSVCNWEDIVRRDFARPLWQRLILYLITLWDFAFSGALLRFSRTSWRFVLYFLYPAFLLSVVFAIAGCAVAWIAGLDFRGSGLAAAGAFPVVAYTLIRWPGDRLFLSHLMDLWIFSRQYLHESRGDVAERTESYARMVVDRAARGYFDEILIIGHSTGCVLALDIAAKALKLDAGLARRGARVSVLTLGSTALKVGMHPAATAYRARLQRMASEPDMGWVEYQSLTDIINFYKSDPVREMGLESLHREAFPIVVRVRFRDMLSPGFYKRIRFNPFRVHYQYVMGNTRRYHYDFFMICCGPLPLYERALRRILGPAGNEEIDA